MNDDEMYREAGWIRGRELADALRRIASTLDGIRQGMDAMYGAGRPCDGGRLDFGTAWECAHAEATWRGRVGVVEASADSWRKSADSWMEAAIERGRRVIECASERDEWRETAKRLDTELDGARSESDRVRDRPTASFAERDGLSRELSGVKKSLATVTAELEAERAHAESTRRAYGEAKCGHDRDFLCVARENTYIRDVVGISDAERVGVIRAHGDGYNAYVRTAEALETGVRERFLGWYSTASHAVAAVVERAKP